MNWRHAGAWLAMLLFPAAAQADPPGFAFLEVPVGARASAMGGAYASVASGVEGVFWNPAALEATHGTQLLAGHVEFLQDLRHEQFAFGRAMWGGGLGLALRAMYSEGIDERDELGNLLGTFGAHDLDFVAAYGRRWMPGLQAGVSLHYIRERIANSAADTYAFDAGMGWEPPVLAGLRLGIAGQHLGPSPHYTIDGVAGSPVPLPAAVQGGASYRLPLGSVWLATGTAEARFTRGRAGQALGGLEISGPGGGALRAGWRGNDDTVSFGAGAGWKSGGLAVDYAFVPYKLDLGDTHRLTLLAQF